VLCKVIIINTEYTGVIIGALKCYVYRRRYKRFAGCNGDGIVKYSKHDYEHKQNNFFNVRNWSRMSDNEKSLINGMPVG
jgi:hypothetical protein